MPIGVGSEGYLWRARQTYFASDTTNSLLIRPINKSPKVDSSQTSALSKATRTSIKAFPVSIDYLFNSHHLVPINSFPATPSKGGQVIYSFGIHYNWRGLSVQFIPQINQVFHPNYQGFYETGGGFIWANRYVWWNRIDEPEKFENVPTTKFRSGQSHIRWSFGTISVGVSSENLWWGPGKYNSLIMSNNCYGFPHLTIQEESRQTRIGRIEWKWIAGQLKSSGQAPSDTNRYDRKIKLYVPKYEENRFLTGLILVYRPIWIKGLSIGYANTIQQYQGSVRAIDIFSSITSSVSSDAGSQGRIIKQQISTFFFRWLFPEDFGELYFEYGIQNSQHKFFNFIKGNAIDAYTIGFTKGIPLGDKNRLGLEMELTQLQQSPYAANSGESFYTDFKLRQGYTHRGKVIGAQIGPGSNLQTLSISYVSEKKLIGVEVQRLAHNNDFYYFTFLHNKDYRRYWIDQIGSIKFSMPFNRLNVLAKLSAIKSINYQWSHPLDPNKPYFSAGKDIFQMQLYTQLSYTF